jgi:hypothetical protein
LHTGQPIITFKPPSITQGERKYHNQYNFGCADQDYGTGLAKADPTGKALTSTAYNGVFLLLLLNCALYAADHLGGLPVSKLYLNHWSPKWYQFLTSAFCHASWQHLSGNAFLLLIFGRNVEEEASF